MSATYTLTDGTTNISTMLAQNAYVIGESIYNKTLYVSNWNAVTPKTALPTGMGEALTSLIYDAAIPTTSANGNTVGANWVAAGADILGSTSLNTSTDGQVVAGAGGETIGVSDPMSYFKNTKILRSYGLDLTRIKSPWFDVNDLRTAAGLQKQVAAIIKSMSQATKWVLERRYQDQWEKLAANLVPCLAAGTPIRTTVDSSASDNTTADNDFYGLNLTGVDFRYSGSGNTDVTPDAYISNAVMDRIYTRLKITAPVEDAYGMDNGKPVFALVIGDQASLALRQEAGYRDDFRDSSMVDMLLKPLGVNQSFRGFYHLCDPTMPRFTISSGVLTRVEPLNEKGQYNSAYDTADYEAFYVLHKEGLEAQVPPPNVSAPGFNFDPVRYTGEFAFVNNKDNTVNLLGDKGFFLSTIGSAMKPKEVEFVYVGLFKRTSTTLAT